MRVVRLADCFGVDCVDPALVEGSEVVCGTDADVAGREDLVVSFEGVLALSPSFVAALLVALEAFKARTGRRVFFEGLVRRHAATLRQVLSSPRWRGRARHGNSLPASP